MGNMKRQLRKHHKEEIYHHFLSNIMLNELDKELEVRYADD